MILGLALPTFADVLPAEKPLDWLLGRCTEYKLNALEATLPLDGKEDPGEIGRRAHDSGIKWIGYWNADLVSPVGGADSLRDRAHQAFDVAVLGGVKTVVLFGAGGRHNRFTREPPLETQLREMCEYLPPVVDAAAERSVQLALLPHLDYRAREIVQVFEKVAHPTLKLAFDTANAFPVCEEPVDAAKVLLPHTVAVAFKDVQIFPYRSNKVTIWGAQLGEGSVDFEAIFPLLNEMLPDPDETTVCIKLRLPPSSCDHEAWLQQSLAYVRSHPALAGKLK